MDNSIWLVVAQLILTAIGAVIVVVPAIYKMKAERKTEETTAASKLSDSAMHMLEKWEASNAMLNEKVDALEVELDRVKRHLEYWMRGCAKLIAQLVANDIDPCWDPNSGPDANQEQEEQNEK